MALGKNDPRPDEFLGTPWTYNALALLVNLDNDLAGVDGTAGKPVPIRHLRGNVLTIYRSVVKAAEEATRE